jgi:hypothetical protein
MDMKSEREGARDINLEEHDKLDMTDQAFDLGERYDQYIKTSSKDNE